MRILADGKRHRREELEACIEDDLADRYRCLNNRLSDIRKKLRPKAEDVIVEWWERRRYYRWVRLIYPEDRG